MLRSLSDHQKELLLFGIQDSFNHASKQGRPAVDHLVTILASDESILSHFEEIYRQVYQKLSEEYGEQNMMSGHEGLWNMQQNPQPAQQE